MSFDYTDLSTIIAKKFGTQMQFAKAMELSERSISLKLNNNVSWKNTEIEKARQLLGIKEKDVYKYFFKTKVQEVEL